MTSDDGKAWKGPKGYQWTNKLNKLWTIKPKTLWTRRPSKLWIKSIKNGLKKLWTKNSAKHYEPKGPKVVGYKDQKLAQKIANYQVQKVMN